MVLSEIEPKSKGAPAAHLPPSSMKGDRPLQRELSLGEIFRLIRHNWSMLALSVSISVGLAILYLLLATPEYKVSMVVARTPTSLSGSSSLSGYQDLASFAGINIGSGNTDFFERFSTLIVSKRVADELEAQRHFLKEIYPGLWDEKKQQWRLNRSPLQILIAGTKSLLTGAQVPKALDGRDLQQFLANNLVFSSDDGSGFLTISLQMEKAELAKNILLALHKSADDVIRKMEQERAIGQLAYLNQKLQESQVAEYRLTIAKLIENQESTLMVLGNGQAFSAEILEPPYVPLEPFSPKPAITLIVAFMFGIFIGSLLAVKVGPVNYGPVTLGELFELVKGQINSMVRRTRHVRAKGKG